MKMVCDKGLARAKERREKKPYFTYANVYELLEFVVVAK